MLIEEIISLRKSNGETITGVWREWTVGGGVVGRKLRG